MERKRKTRKLPNGYGSIRKLQGRRTNPYQVLVTIGWDDSGKQLQKPIGYYRTRVDALSALAEYHRNPFDVGVNPTFKDMYEKIDQSKMSRSKRNAMQTAYKRSEKLWNKTMRSLRTADYQEVAHDIISLSASSQLEQKILWTTINKRALQEDIILKDYSKFVVWESEYQEREKLAFTSEQVNSMCEDMQILCFTGMRINEYLSVTTADIKDGCIYCNGTKTKQAVRIIPIHEKIAEIVNLRLTGAYLCEHKGKQMGYETFRRLIFTPEMERLGVDGMKLHDTRRTFSSFCSRSGMDKEITKRIFGHKCEELIENTYTVKNIDDLKNEMAKLVI